MIPTHLLTDVPRGEWVALSHTRDRLVAHAVDLKEVLQQARSEGEDDPFVLRIPKSFVLYSRSVPFYGNPFCENPADDASAKDIAVSEQAKQTARKCIDLAYEHGLKCETGVRAVACISLAIRDEFLSV